MTAAVPVDAAADRERHCIASLLARPEWIGSIDLAPADLAHPMLAAALAAMQRLACEGRPIELVSIADAMGAADAGALALAEAVDDPLICASLEALRDLAAAIRTDALSRRIARAASALREAPADAEAQGAMRALLEERDALATPYALDAAAIGFAGASLRALRDRPRRASPLPGVLDDEPHLHVLAGRAKSGKTTLALAIARAWGLGVAPWPMAPALPGSRVLVLSREQSATRLDATLRRLDDYASDALRDAYAERLVVVARDAELPAPGRSLLTLDDAGLRALRAVLAAAEAEGDPIGLLILDSLARLKPPTADENSNDDMSAWLDAIEAVAIEARTYIILVHHVGHAVDPSRSEARTAGRGASAIAACAQVVLLLDRADDPRLRRLRADGNAILAAETMYRVCGDDAEPGAIHYWRPIDPLDEHDPAELLGASAISTSALAWRLAGREPQRAGDRPPGEAMTLAARLRETWARQGRVEILDGPRGARLIALRSGDQ